MTFTELLGQSALAGTLLMIAAFAADRLMRGAPAAWRHFLWTVVLAGLLVLPLAVRVTPKWAMQAAPAFVPPETLTVLTPEPARAPLPPASPRLDPLLFGWLTGCVLTALWFLAGRFRVWRVVRCAREAAYAHGVLDCDGVRVVEAAAAPTAMAAGIWKPVIVLPADAPDWPTDRLRAALLHELLHVQRRDLAAQAIAQLACCVYWFHPLTWMAALRLRREREQACDDAVLGRGVAAHEYAGHLVALVRALQGRRSPAVSMAEPSQLESRVRALLDGGRDRRPLNRRTAFAMLAVLAAVLLPLSAFTVHAQAAPTAWIEVRDIAADDPVPQTPAPVLPGIVSGTVEDPSGARIPGADVIVRNQETKDEQSTHADAAGVYSFYSLPAGRYELAVQSPGFKTLRRTGIAVEAGKAVPVNAQLVVGSVTEALTITAMRPTGKPLPAAAGDPRRIRVGGNVKPVKLLYKVAPDYPEDAKTQGISGIVHLVAIISKQGFLTEIHAMGGPDALVPAAVEAASHWLYEPSLLNGEPVAIQTSIDIAFELK